VKLRRTVWPQCFGYGRSRNQVRNERVSWRRLLFWAQRCDERIELFRREEIGPDAAGAEIQKTRFRLHLRRSGIYSESLQLRQEEDIFLLVTGVAARFGPRPGVSRIGANDSGARG